MHLPGIRSPDVTRSDSHTRSPVYASKPIGIQTTASRVVPFYLLRFTSSRTLPGCGWLRRPGGRANVRVATARRVPPGAAKYYRDPPPFSGTGFSNRSQILLSIVKPASILFFFFLNLKISNTTYYLSFIFTLRPHCF